MTREGTGVPEWWWSVLLSFIPINPDNRPAICGHLKTGSQYRGLLSKWWNQILQTSFTSFIQIFELKCQLRVLFLCVIVMRSHLHLISSQVTRMVSWSPHCARLCYWGGVALDHSRHHRFVTQRADTGCGVSPGADQGPPGRLQPSQMVNRSAQTHNLIMGSRHTSKDSVHHLFGFSSSFVYSHFKNSRFFENFPTHLSCRQGWDLVLQQRNHETKAT